MRVPSSANAFFYQIQSSCSPEKGKMSGNHSFFAILDTIIFDLGLSSSNLYLVICFTIGKYTTVTVTSQCFHKKKISFSPFFLALSSVFISICINFGQYSKANKYICWLEKKGVYCWTRISKSFSWIPTQLMS